MSIQIYTDGACRGNPGKGAWATVIKVGSRVFELGQYCEGPTTNNVMELSAALMALAMLGDKPLEVSVYSDSKYLVDGITSWVKGWKRNNWTKKGGEIANLDLWMKLDLLNTLHTISWYWVKGHSTNKDNARCDAICNICLNTESNFKKEYTV